MESPYEVPFNEVPSPIVMQEFSLVYFKEENEEENDSDD